MNLPYQLRFFFVISGILVNERSLVFTINSPSIPRINKCTAVIKEKKPINPKNAALPTVQLKTKATPPVKKEKRANNTKGNANIENPLRGIDENRIFEEQTLL